ncbi:beta-lactamase family protein [bacterium]|nr:beta-lactamase family protein [bacterium]
MKSLYVCESGTHTVRSTLCVLVFLSLLIACDFSPAGRRTGTPGNKAHLARLIDRYIHSFPPYEEFNGVILVADGNDILFHKAYGMADREFGIPNSLDTRFQIGSITKVFTAMLALKLVEQGVLDLEGTISDYLPWYPAETGSSITVRHLLSNTSGIPHHYQAVPDYFSRHDHFFHTPRELIALFQDTPLQHAPGERFTYSSPGFYILGAIMQRVTRRSYAELLQEYIFSPLDMHDTFVENNRTTDARLATGYMRGLSGCGKAYIEDKSTALAAGDLLSTAHDLYLWQKTLCMKGDSILTAASKAAMYQPVLPGTFMTMAGPLFRIPYENGEKTLAVNLINGSSSGYSAAIGRQTEANRCVIVLSNVNGDDVSRIADDIGDIFMRRYIGTGIGPEAPLTRTPPPAAVSPGYDPNAVLGWYRDRGNGFTGVVRDAGKLYYLSFSGRQGLRQVMELIPAAKDTFFLGHDTSFSCRFSRDENGTITGLTAVRNGRTFNEAMRCTVDAANSPGCEGWYTSLELQKTYHISRQGDDLSGRNFLRQGDIPFVPLGNDLCGFSAGCIRFIRDPGGTVTGFDVFTKDTDRYFGSRFIRTAP